MSSNRPYRFLSLLRKFDRSNLKSELSNLSFPLSSFHFPLPSAARARAGSALVIVLGMLSVLLLMGVAFSVTMRTERAGAANMRHAAIARHILDSAIARTMADLDRALYEQGDHPVPTGGVIVAISQQPGGEASVSPLSYEASLHIPGDQLAACVFTNAQWLPIYGDVRITGTEPSDVTSEDSPVGRYAYVILNGSGYLDPNVVGTSNRLYGLSPAEIDIAGEGGRVLGMPGAISGSAFIAKRNNDWGHFASMRDFLRYSVTNALKYRPMDISGANYRFPTNSFFVGSLALDDFAPPTGVQKVGSGSNAKYYPIRKPKFSLRDDNGDIKSANDLKDDPLFWEAMTNSFLATYKAQANNDGRLPRNYTDPADQGLQFDYPLLAARNLLDMMDEDGYPGGSNPRSMNAIGGSDDYDEYLRAKGLRCRWHHLPCVEPAPLLDNLVILGGDLDENVFSPLVYHPDVQSITNSQTGDVSSSVTNITFTITLSALSVPIYPGWNVPDGMEGRYTFLWRIIFPDPNDPADTHNFDAENAGVGSNDNQRQFLDNLKAALTQSCENMECEFSLDVDTQTGARRYPQYWRLQTEDIRVERIPRVITFSVPVTSGTYNTINATNIGEFVPEEFGFVVHAVGFMGRGSQSQYRNNLVQVVPGQQGVPLTTYDGMNRVESFLDIPLIIRRSDAIRDDQTGNENLPVLGAVYAIDPRFAFTWGSWEWVPGLSDRAYNDEPYIGLAESLREERMEQLSILDGVLNPLEKRYLQTPYRRFQQNMTVFDTMYAQRAGVFGVSDEMRSFPKASDYSISDNTKMELAALSVFFDLSAADDSPWAFTRVGQLGYVPIGTYRTIALMDGFDNTDDSPHVEVRQRVVDYFTMNPPRDPGSSGSNPKPVRTELFTSRVGITPPWFPELNDDNEVVPGDPNLLPITAALNACPLREWDDSSSKVDWDTAADMADVYAEALNRGYKIDRNGNYVTDKDGNLQKDKDDLVWNEDGIKEPSGISDDQWEDFWDKASDAGGVTRSLSVLGRSRYDSDAEECISIDSILREQFTWATSIDREGVIRNTAEMLTTRQQLFTILLKADSFTPMSGFSDANHGMSLASVQAIAHVWRDPEPLRDAEGKVILDGPNGQSGNPIHAWVLLDLYQF